MDTLPRSPKKRRVRWLARSSRQAAATILGAKSVTKAQPVSPTRHAARNPVPPKPAAEDCLSPLTGPIEQTFHFAPLSPLFRFRISARLTGAKRTT
jgi:hypothetical protein